MVEPKTASRKRTLKRRAGLRLTMGVYPPPLRRFMIAGATVCHTIRALAQITQQSTKGEDEHDST